MREILARKFMGGKYTVLEVSGNNLVLDVNGSIRLKAKIGEGTYNKVYEIVYKSQKAVLRIGKRPMVDEEDRKQNDDEFKLTQKMATRSICPMVLSPVSSGFIAGREHAVMIMADGGVNFADFISSKKTILLEKERDELTQKVVHLYETMSETDTYCFDVKYNNMLCDKFKHKKGYTTCPEDVYVIDFDRTFCYLNLNEINSILRKNNIVMKKADLKLALLNLMLILVAAGAVEASYEEFGPEIDIRHDTFNFLLPFMRKRFGRTNFETSTEFYNMLLIMISVKSLYGSSTEVPNIYLQLWWYTIHAFTREKLPPKETAEQILKFALNLIFKGPRSAFGLISKHKRFEQEA